MALSMSRQAPCWRRLTFSLRTIQEAAPILWQVLLMCLRVINLSSMKPSCGAWLWNFSVAQPLRSMIVTLQLAPYSEGAILLTFDEALEKVMQRKQAEG